MRTAGFLMVMVAGALAGCGSGSSGGGGLAAASPDWAKDACKTFPREAAAGPSGLALTQETPGASNSAGDTDVSSCSYSTADSKTFTVLLRNDRSGTSKIDDQITGLTSEPDMTGPSVEVAMPSGKAIWAPKLRTLSWVPDDNRMIVVTPPDAIVVGGVSEVPEEELKAKAIKIATAIPL